MKIKIKLLPVIVCCLSGTVNIRKFSRIIVSIGMATLFAGCLDTSDQNQENAAAKIVPGCGSQGDSDQHNPHCAPTPTPGSGFQAANPLSVPFGLGFVDYISMAVQPDGKILFAGGSGSSSSKLKLARYNSDGTIDSSFGDNGFALADYGGNSYFMNVALQADGKIIATGASYNFDSIIVRFNANGSIDTSFQVIDIRGNNNNGFYFPIIQADGKILAKNQSTIYRFNSNGTADTSFANVGHTNVYITSMALQNDQKIVACGATRYWLAPGHPNGYWSDDFTTVMRINADGSADNSFGSSGVTPALLFGAKPCDAIAMQPDGKILIGGNFWNANSGDPNTLNPNLVYIIRLNSNGSLDSSFATGGILIHSMPKVNYSHSVASILPLSNGKIFVAGNSGTFELTSSGAIDDSYVSPILADSQNGSAAAAISPSGDIIMNWIWGGAGYIYLIKP